MVGTALEASRAGYSSSETTSFAYPPDYADFALGANESL